jgi:hypothetical protein
VNDAGAKRLHAQLEPGLRTPLRGRDLGVRLYDNRSGMGLARGDADADGDLDLLTTNFRRNGSSLFLLPCLEVEGDDATTLATPVAKFESAAPRPASTATPSRWSGGGCSLPRLRRRRRRGPLHRERRDQPARAAAVRAGARAPLKNRGDGVSTTSPLGGAPPCRRATPRAASWPATSTATATSTS